jgi:uncharacterized protein involved in outer membrane biogenesis
MKKWILIGAASVIVVIIIILIIGISNIGPLIKKTVNAYGPGITKTEVRIGDVGVSILSGEARLKDFYLGNPKGFTSPDAIKVKSIFVNLDERSLTKDTIIIDRIEVVRPEITYEKARGTDNFKNIIDNVKQTMGVGKSPEKQPAERKEGKKLLIRDFVVKEGRVTLVTPFMGGKSIGAPMPNIHLTNIGGEKEGVSSAKAFEQILMALYAKITSPEVSNILNEELKKLGKGLETAGEEVKKQLETLDKGTKEDLFKRVPGKIKELIDKK